MSIEQSPLPLANEIFIARLWREAPDSRIWRGQVQHVRTGRVIVVSSAQELWEWMLNEAAALDSAPPAKGGLK